MADIRRSKPGYRQWTCDYGKACSYHDSFALAYVMMVKAVSFKHPEALLSITVEGKKFEGKDWDNRKKFNQLKE